jgi:hypothetical protein
MIENLAERLAQSKHRWLIVTGVTLLIGLVSALPQVDLLLAERSERTSLQEELTQAEATAARLPDYERKLAEKQEQLGRLRQLVVDESQLGALRRRRVSRDAGFGGSTWRRRRASRGVEATTR